MSKVFVNIGLSLDGYVAPEGMTMENRCRRRVTGKRCASVAASCGGGLAQRRLRRARFPRAISVARASSREPQNRRNGIVRLRPPVAEWADDQPRAELSRISISAGHHQSRRLALPPLLSQL